MSEEKKVLSRIRREPVLIRLLKERKPILPRPFRDDILDRLELIAIKLRNPEYFADVAASTLLGTILGIPISLVLEAIRRR